MIKAVLFDVDGVLIDSFEGNLKFSQDTLTMAGYGPLTREMYSHMYHLSFADVAREVTKSNSEKEIQRLLKMAQQRVVPFPYDLYRLHTGVTSTIRKLAKKYILGLVTSKLKNGIFEYSKLKELQKYFSTVAAYEDTVNHKPHPEPLLFAAHNLNVTPREVIYIGDLDSDILAARSAGMKVIIYSNTPFTSSDAYTNSFKEIPKLINRLNG
jgi:HAD superfamily hydrolase (TIGR01509 family)